MAYSYLPILEAFAAAYNVGLLHLCPFLGSKRSQKSEKINSLVMYNKLMIHFVLKLYSQYQITILASIMLYHELLHYDYQYLSEMQIEVYIFFSLNI